jgi:hypothetical protein
MRQILESRFRPRMDDQGTLMASTASIGYDFQYDPALVGEQIGNPPPAVPQPAAAGPGEPAAAGAE